MCGLRRDVHPSRRLRIARIQGQDDRRRDPERSAVRRLPLEVVRRHDGHLERHQGIRKAARVKRCLSSGEAIPDEAITCSCVDSSRAHRAASILMALRTAVRLA